MLKEEIGGEGEQTAGRLVAGHQESDALGFDVLVRQALSAHRAQMGAYAEALGVIFPGRTIRSALLYTSAPRLFELGS